MTLTDYHSAYFARELTKRCAPDSLEKLAGALVDAQVDLNPHQVEAALFAFRSPLSRGAILADEVGLGKTIEAGLVLSQKWAERKRRLLIVTPANLRKQWHQELQEKFFLPCRILEAKSYNEAIRRGSFQPFVSEPDAVVICSYQFAKSKAADVHNAGWDLVVIDEAHRLRNVYKTSNVIANVLKNALAKFPKILLTATPLQNSLLELFGLVSFIDDRAFGDLGSFRDQFSKLADEPMYQALKTRLKPLCHRTLRRQVLEYVDPPFTNRLAIVEEFTPDRNEDRLYTEVSEYLQRDNLQALPASQRALMTLVLRKLLASSTFAIAGALMTLILRMKGKLKASDAAAKPFFEQVEEDYEGLQDTAEEWDDDEDDDAPLSEKDREALAQEVKELEAFRELAIKIHDNAKGRALLIALEKAFAEAARLGAKRKAIVFTESRKTQNYLLQLLAENGYAGKVVLFNGTNTDASSKQLYTAWAARNAGTDKVTGSRTADMRSAIVEEFRDRAEIMIATEAGAEGINLQFCSLVVNYDLPWNPQRIEQRIGRCHRYGQKHDVVVVNFLNRNNEADQRVFQLLSEKFRLFEGVFGASDEVLGAIESGVDFEKRIANIYQNCRAPEEIRASFNQLQQDLASEIDDRVKHTRRQLLENFDEEVHQKLKISKAQSEGFQNRFEKLLLRLTCHELAGFVTFPEEGDCFELTANPFPDLQIPLGRYELPRRTGNAHYYRLGHPLAARIVERALQRPLPPAELVFDYEACTPRVGALQSLRGKSGELLLELLSVESLDHAEDHILATAVTADGEVVPAEVVLKFFSLPVRSVHPLDNFTPDACLTEDVNRQQADERQKIAERNGRLFEEEVSKLEAWADDLKTGLEREIKDLDRQMKEARRAATAALSLQDKLAGQKEVKRLESLRNAKRRSLYEAQDEIEQRRDTLVAEVEAKLDQKVTLTRIMSIRWKVA